MCLSKFLGPDRSEEIERSHTASRGRVRTALIDTVTAEIEPSCIGTVHGGKGASLLGRVRANVNRRTSVDYPDP